MTITEFLATADIIGTTESLSAGIDKLYLVPLGDDFNLFLKKETMTSFPAFSAIPLDFEMEIHSAVFTSTRKEGTAGWYFENILNVNLLSDVADWFAENQEKRFWIIALMGERWIVTGDEQMPYRISNEYTLGRAPGQKQGWELSLRSDQLRPYHVYNILGGGGGSE